MTQIGKIVLAAGILLVFLGLLLWGLGKSGFRGLPGDIRFESENLRLYLPVITCLVLSVLLSAVAWMLVWLWQWFRSWPAPFAAKRVSSHKLSSPDGRFPIFEQKV